MSGASYSPTAVLSADDPPLPQGDPSNLDGARKMRDTRKLLRSSLLAQLDWSRELEVLPGGSRTAFTVRIGAITIGTFFDTGALYALGYAGGTIDQTKAAGSALAATSQPWYAYAFRGAGGAIDFEITTTAPTAARKFKTGTFTHHYLGTFFTDSTGAPIPMLAVRGRCLYRRSAIASVDGAFAANGLRAVAAGGGAVALTALDLSARVPPHARRAVLYGESVVTSSAGAATTTLALYDAADTTSPSQEIAASVIATGDTGRNSARAEVQLTSAQLCGYAVVGTSDVHSATVDVMGWEE